MDFALGIKSYNHNPEVNLDPEEAKISDIVADEP